jgi:hypothetical protein
MNVVSGSQSLLNALLREGLPPLPQDLAVISSFYLPALYLRCCHDREFASFAETAPHLFLSVLEKYIGAIGMLLNPDMITSSKRVFRAPVVHLEFQSSMEKLIQLDVKSFSYDVEPLSDAEVFLEVRNLAVRVWGLVNYIFISATIPSIIEFARFSEKLQVTVSPFFTYLENPSFSNEEEIDVGDLFASEDDVPVLTLPLDLGKKKYS